MKNFLDRLELPDVYDSSDLSFKGTMSNPIHLGTDSIAKYLEFKIRQEFVDARTSYIADEVTVVCTHQELLDSLSEFVISVGTPRSGFAGLAIMYVGDVAKCLVKYDGTSDQIDVTISGEPDKVKLIKNRLEASFEHPAGYVKWVYDPQYLEDIQLPLPTKNLPFDSMYPFLKDETLKEYFHRFDQSDSGILLLLGQPGTGKTSFIRGLLQETQQNAMLTYHEKILEQDGFFANWFASSTENYLVVEDADKIIAPRSDGNSMMQRFLNLGDGLVARKNKKLIFSTNLPNTAAIDEAMLRKGRCHDILQFRSLTRDEAIQCASDAGIEFSQEGSSFTIAEIFADVKSQSKSIPKKKSTGFGFLS